MKLEEEHAADSATALAVEGNDTALAIGRVKSAGM